MKPQYLALVIRRFIEFCHYNTSNAQICGEIAQTCGEILTHLLSTDVCFWMKFNEETFPLKTKFADLCP